MTSELSDICRLGVAGLTKAYGDGELSPVEAVRATLLRADQVDERYNAFVTIDHERALSAARESAARWRAGAALSAIDGVPTTIKDIVQAQGFDVRYGSTTTDDISGEEDAPSVARLRQAGAVILGLTTTPEFGWKAVTDSRKDGVTRNPWNTDLTPGGSSGGAAVAAATGAGVLHLGTDGGGSIRIPAAFTGTVGHKPSFGRVAAFPASSFGTVAHIGPIARTVEDTAAMLDVMTGRDLRDWTQPPFEFEPLSVSPIEWTGRRIGYWKHPCLGSVDPQISNAVENVLRDLQMAGAQVEEVRLPDQEILMEVFYRHWFVGAARRLAIIDPARHAAIDTGFLAAAEVGRRYTAVDRMTAELQRARFGAQMDALLHRFDFLISPSVPILPFAAGYEVPPESPVRSSFEWSSFSFPINLSQQPACSVPCGLSEEGLPMGLQIVSRRGGDSKVLGAALSYQRMYPERFLTSATAWPLGEGKNN